MTGFVLAAAAAVFVVLVLLLRPFLRKTAQGEVTSHRQLNAAIYREQIARLDQDQAEGLLAKEEHAQARAELQRRLLDETQEADATATLHAPRKTMVAVGLLLPVLATALYLTIGNPAGLSPENAVAAHAGPDENLVRMVATLAEKMEKDPGNLKGWAMLARSYKAIDRPIESEKAFERAGAFIDDDAQALADYADVAATNANGRFAGKPQQLIDKALKADPNHPMSMWLAGTAALESQDYTRAVRTWERLVALLPPESEDARMLQGAINDVRSRAGIAVAAAPAAAPAKATTPAPGAGAVSAAGSVSGTVELAPLLQGQASANDTVMVIARPVGSRMPLAVLRVPVSQLPLKFSLNDSMAMSPEALISKAGQVEVEARISKTGMAQAASGDLVSEVQTVKVGASNVALRVAQVRK